MERSSPAVHSRGPRKDARLRRGSREPRHRLEEAARIDDRERNCSPGGARSVADPPCVGGKPATQAMRTTRSSRLSYSSATSLTPFGCKSDRNFPVASRWNFLSVASIHRKNRFRLANANRGLLNNG